jgi:hypothetical protein
LLTPTTVVLLAGCSLLYPGASGALTFDETKSVAAELRDSVQDSLPESDVIESSDNDTVISCGEDAAQSDLNRTFAVDDELDRVAWLESVSKDFRARDGWRVEDKVAADGSSNALTAVSAFSDDGYYIRVGEFAARDGKPATIVVSASAPCSPW